MSDVLDYNKKKDKQTMIDADTGERRKEQYVEDIRDGDVVNDLFAVKIKKPPRPYKRGIWFDLIVTDKTGEIPVKYWGGENKERVKRLYDSFKVGDVIQLRLGNVEIYEEKPQISINEKTGGLRRCNPKEYNIGDFIPSIEEEKINKLTAELKGYIEKIENKQLKSLLKSFFDDPGFMKQFAESPSAITHHHNYVGGNLEHTIGVVRLCDNICNTYPDADKDVVITGAILHDVGKLKEYRATAAVEKTEKGNFIGHIVMGDRWVRQKILELQEKGESFDELLEDKICHIILSHHGKYEFGSPRLPNTIEAMIVHQADMMDSQVKNFIQNIKEGRNMSDDNWVFVWDPDVGSKRPMYVGEEEV